MNFFKKIAAKRRRAERQRNESLIRAVKDCVGGESQRLEKSLGDLGYKRYFCLKSDINDLTKSYSELVKAIVTLEGKIDSYFSVSEKAAEENLTMGELRDEWMNGPRGADK